MRLPKTCAECEHTYRTKRELRRDYRRTEWSLMRQDDPWWRWPYWYLRALFIRTGRIFACPRCMHDFWSFR